MDHNRYQIERKYDDFILNIIQTNMNLNWIAEATSVTNRNIIFDKFDIERYNILVDQFQKLPSEDKKIYKGREDYIEKEGGINITAHQKNYKKLIDEMEASFEKGSYLGILAVNMYSEKDTIMDLLASLENENYIKEVYRKKKLRVTGTLKTDTAMKLKDSIRQGRSLLQSAQKANMLSKPLIDFYAASAYAYATIVINSPLHKSFDSLKSSHGHTYVHSKGTVEFGGDSQSGTFVDLLASTYITQIISEDVCFRYNSLSSLEFVQNNRISLSLIALLSAVPELQEQVSRIKTAKKIVHKLIIKSEVVNKSVSYVFEIGDGISKPEKKSLQNTFKTSEIREIHGKYVISIAAQNITNIMPTIYQDTRGELWYVEPLIEGLYLSEMCLHFLIISALCNIMRYSPHEWNNILSNKVSSDFSLLISKYLRLFELKYPMLLTQQLTDFSPIIVAR